MSLSLGGSFDIGVEVTNTSESRLAEIVIHIDVTEPSSSTSVDPEDWVSTLSRRVDGLDAGETALVRWALKPIAGGDFLL